MRQDPRGRRCPAVPETLIIARTDAMAVEGFERAIERAARYREAGADMLFVEAPKTRDDLARMVSALGTDAPLMANMVEGGKTPPLPAAELEALGFALVIFPGGIVRALARTASDYYGSLAAHGTTEPFRDRMLDFDGLNALIGTPEMIALGKRYETSAAPAEKKSGVAGDLARSGHACGAQRPAGTDRRRDGRDALPLGVQSDHRRGARCLPRPL